MTDPTSSLTWKISFSLLTNPNIVKSWLKAMGLTYLVCMVFLVPIFIATGEMDGVPMIMAIFAGVVCGLALLGFVIMFLMLGNRSHAKFTLSDRKILYENMDRRIKMLSRMAVMSGGILGNPTTAGAGLLSVSNEAVSLKWKSVSMAKYDPKHLTICLKNSYRELLHLYCNEENYTHVEAFVQYQLNKNKADEYKGSTIVKSSQKQVPFPLTQALIHTGLVIIISMSLFALSDITNLDFLIPMLIMAFSLAMVWMIPLFGWVVLVMEGYLMFQVMSALLLVREYKLVSTYSFRKYEVLDTGEWTLVCLASIGLVYLSWISIRLINGKMISIFNNSTD